MPQLLQGRQEATESLGICNCTRDVPLRAQQVRLSGVLGSTKNESKTKRQRVRIRKLRRHESKNI